MFEASNEKAKSTPTMNLTPPSPTARRPSCHTAMIVDARMSALEQEIEMTPPFLTRGGTAGTADTLSSFNNDDRSSTVLSVTSESRQPEGTSNDSRFYIYMGLITVTSMIGIVAVTVLIGVVLARAIAPPISEPPRNPFGRIGDGRPRPTTPATAAPSAAVVDGQPSPLDFDVSPTASVTATNNHATVQVTLEEMAEVLSTVSDRNVLMQQGSDQNRALEWMFEEDQLRRMPFDRRFIQRYVMVLFYFATDGDNWGFCNRATQTCGPNTDAHPFLSTAIDECQWGTQGHSQLMCNCDEETDDGSRIGGTICEVNLVGQITSNFSLKGTIPSELSALKDLRAIRLNNNQIIGSIPTELGSLPSLHTIDLSDNRLTGTILPRTFHFHPSLAFYAVDRNNLTSTDGGLPPGFGSMSHLSNLLLDNNALNEGTIPAELGNLENLVRLSASNLNLIGSIPSELEQLQSLETLRLDHNKLRGALPERSLFDPRGGGWKNLRRLNLSYNLLSGHLSPNIESWGSGTIQGKSYDLSNNRFTGTIPIEVGSINGLVELRLHGNQFVGSVPQELCQEAEGAAIFGLHTLTADCDSDTNGVPVRCDCCTDCL